MQFRVSNGTMEYVVEYEEDESITRTQYLEYMIGLNTHLGSLRCATHHNGTLWCVPTTWIYGFILHACLCIRLWLETTSFHVPGPISLNVIRRPHGVRWIRTEDIVEGRAGCIQDHQCLNCVQSLRYRKFPNALHVILMCHKYYTESWLWANEIGPKSVSFLLSSEPVR